MLPLVDAQALRAAEASRADVAAVRPLARVQPEVVLEAGGSREALIALGAVKLLPEVDLLVLPQAARLVEAPLAHRAVVRPLPRVREPVSVHGPRVGEGLPAVRADERLLPRVDLLVTFELTFLRELLGAHGALVGFLSRVDSHVDLKGGHLVAVPPAEPAAVRALRQAAVALLLPRGGRRTLSLAVGDSIGILSRRCGNKDDKNCSFRDTEDRRSTMNSLTPFCLLKEYSTHKMTSCTSVPHITLPRNI